MSTHHAPLAGDRHSSASARTALVTRLVVGAALAGALAACGTASPTGPGRVTVRADQTTPPTDTTAHSGYQNPMI